MSDWTITQRPAAWHRGRRINGFTAYHEVRTTGPEYGKRLAIADFHCGSSRVVPLDEVEVEVVVEHEATR